VKKITVRQRWKRSATSLAAAATWTKQETHSAAWHPPASREERTAAQAPAATRTAAELRRATRPDEALRMTGGRMSPVGSRGRTRLYAEPSSSTQYTTPTRRGSRCIATATAATSAQHHSSPPRPAATCPPDELVSNVVDATAEPCRRFADVTRAIPGNRIDSHASGSGLPEPRRHSAVIATI
jgi:hypothetical protein